MWLAGMGRRGRQWSEVTGGNSRVTAAGSPGGGGVSNGALGWEKGVSLQCEAREAGAESPLRHTARDEGTGRAGTLGEESLGLPYLPSSRDWCVPPKPININIGKFHCRVICQCGPAAVAKLQLPSCLGKLG